MARTEADGDPECIAWRCKRCGEWIRDEAPSTPCLIAGEGRPA